MKTTTDATNMQYAVIEGVSFGILDGVNSILKVNDTFEKIFMVGGGSRSSFWIELLASLLNKNLSVCDQSEYGAALGVARLAMHSDENIKNKDDLIKEIKIGKSYSPSSNKTDILMKRYQIWKELYFTNKNIASKMIS